jgi:hypothetical protein
VFLSRCFQNWLIELVKSARHVGRGKSGKSGNYHNLDTQMQVWKRRQQLDTSAEPLPQKPALDPSSPAPYRLETSPPKDQPRALNMFGETPLPPSSMAMCKISPHRFLLPLPLAASGNWLQPASLTRTRRMRPRPEAPLTPQPHLLTVLCYSSKSQGGITLNSHRLLGRNPPRFHMQWSYMQWS